MNTRLIGATTFMVVATLFSGCASSLAMQGSLTKKQVEKILTQEKIGRVSSIEQQPQDDGSVTLLVTSNLRETSFGGCLADRTDIEVVRSDQEWTVNSMSEDIQLSLFSCSKAGEFRFAFVSGTYADKKLDRAVGYLKELMAGSLAPALISGSSELKGAVQDMTLNDVHWVFIKEDGVEFQVLNRAIAPRLLGIRFSIEDGQLKRVHLNDDNSIEVVEPNQ